MKKLIFLFFVCSTNGFSQNQSELDSINNVLITAKQTNNWTLLVDTYYNKGRYFFVERNYAEALPFFLKVDSISKKQDLKSETLVKSVLDRAEISRVTFTHDGIEQAAKLMYEALGLAKEIESEELIHLTYKYLADLEGLRGNLDEAKQYLDLAFDYYKKKDDVTKVGQLYAIYINYFNATDQLDKSEQANKDRIAYLKTKTDTLRLANAIVTYGNFKSRKRNDCKDALKQYEQAETLYKAVLKDEPYNNYRKLTQGMAACFASINNHKKAYEYAELAYDLRDKLNKKYNQDLSLKLEATYQTKQKEREITLLKSQNELAEQQKTNQRNLLLGGLGLTTIAGLFFFFQYRNRQRTNKKLRELDAAKSSFFANISHEFRTPLTLIQSPIEDELQNPDLSEQQRKKFKLIKRNSSRLLNLVDQLLLLSKAEANALKLQVDNTNISEIIAAIASAFEYSFQQKGISFKTVVDIGQLGFIDVDIIEKILTNLLSNALKYTSENGSVQLTAKSQGEQLIIQVSNSGVTLSNQTLQNIFKKFYQVNTEQKGYGIGLALVKELTEIHNGKINVSNENDLLTFSVSLPIVKSAFNSEDISISTKTYVFENEDIVTQLSEDLEQTENIISTSEKPILLIVEDNDDMRSFTKSLFAESFNVIEAKNGKQGVKKAIEHIPDIIISDVMMPKIDGIQLVNTLKTDEKTSHIPIVLLTAKVEEEDQIKGILTGADDYLTKPFSPKLIAAKIETLLKNRDKTKAHYSHEVQLKPAVFSVNTSEEQFFNKLQSIISNKLENPDFNVDAFSQEIGMSRMQLHRKLKATLGISASEFLRTERLKAARHLLLTTQLSVSEVAYASGFNDANYFGKSFKQLFKVSPSEIKST